ncbi:MAG TPA: hypothetical protein QGG30_03980 [Acidobacteriota bacterium]|jgi:hypothetical protein|nr:hypothetical protein [Acidobacteriota bacterium]
MKSPTNSQPLERYDRLEAAEAAGTSGGCSAWLGGDDFFGDGAVEVCCVLSAFFPKIDMD